MKRFFTWFYYLSKRQLKNIFFVLVLLLIPLCSIMLKSFGNSLKASLAIGIVDLDKTSLSDDLVNSLNTTDENSVVTFKVYDNTSDMDNDILSGKIQCGYSILSGFQDKVSKSSLKNLIDVHSKPDSSIILLSNELLFTYIFREAGYYTLIKDMEDSNIFNNIKEITNFRLCCEICSQLYSFNKILKCECHNQCSLYIRYKNSSSILFLSIIISN